MTQVATRCFWEHLVIFLVMVGAVAASLVMPLGFRYVLALAFLVLYIFFNKNNHVVGGTLIALLAIAVGLGPAGSAREYQEWSDRFKRSPIKGPWGEIGLPVPIPTATVPGPPRPPEHLDRYTQAGPLGEQNSLINNGGFAIPLTSTASRWGTGLYVDGLVKSRPEKPVWINFKSADINASVVLVESGKRALKIENKSGSIPDVVGVMEQRITVTPGRYQLSFWAAAEPDVESHALEFVTTQEWDLRPEHGGYELKEHGPFDWKPFSEIITIEQAGPVTFALVSKGRGTIYITDLSLVRLPE